MMVENTKGIVQKDLTEQIYYIEPKKQVFYEFMKRFSDIVLSFAGILFLLPLFCVIALLIKIEDNGPVFFTQIRCGKNNKPFKIYKFRSMCINAEEKLNELMALNERDGPVFKIENDPRVTKIGKFLRKTCIDELPQLINILKGDMSIVGPRPPLPKEVEDYSDYHKLRLSVKPGLTCYWQVKKSQYTTFDDWVESDLKYINERSFIVDTLLIFNTIKVVLNGLGDK